MHTAFEGPAEGHNVLAVTCDVSDKAQVAAMIDLAVKPYGLHQSLQGRTSWMLRHKRSHASPTRTLRPLCDKISMPQQGSDGLVVAGLAALTDYSAVFAELQQRAPLPLLSLVEAVCHPGFGAQTGGSLRNTFYNAGELLSRCDPRNTNIR
jgi:hypothetical protein